ncbi:MAG: VWA domain-containing protein [Promethearchaeota archaeon]
MQDNIKTEDTVILIDVSRSMVRKDFKPNRLAVALNAVNNFIQTKFTIDPKDRIALLSFGNTINKLCAFTYEEDKLINSLKKIKIGGNGQLHDGISFALQLLVEEMRKLGGKIPRIFIISDSKLKLDNKLQKLVSIAAGLGIFIDTCQLGTEEVYTENVFKKISRETGGEYGFFNNSKAILNAGRSFASKKASKTTTDYFAPDKQEEIAPLVSDIALPLRRPSLLDIRLMMSKNGSGQDKCQICHSIKAPLTSADFYSEGRYCPSCDRPMHISCATMWAKKTEYAESVFRCPFCYFLLELPAYATKLIKEKIEDEPKIKLLSQDDAKSTHMILINEENVSEIDVSCNYCYSIFLGDYNVYQCEKCKSYYHEPCLEKMNKEIQACRNCGAKITFS